MCKAFLEASWQEELKEELEQKYFQNLLQFLETERARGKIIYPKEQDIFKAFEYTAFANAKIIILGQDPYHNEGQADGLSFSVGKGVAIPPSLSNIFKELHNDLGVGMAQDGDLGYWARQGVLLLNAALTVEANKPMSHSHIGWHFFTNAVISALSERKEHLVFILWGQFAQSKASLIDDSRHLILQSAHPSPLSAYRGFWNCKHFSKANNYLTEHCISTIDWSLDCV